MKKTWKSPKDVPGPAVRVIQHRRTFNIDPYFVFWWRNIYFVHFCSNKISLLCFYSFDLSWWFFCIFVQKNILTVLLFFARAARGLKTKMCAELKSVQYWIVVSGELMKFSKRYQNPPSQWKQKLWYIYIEPNLDFDAFWSSRTTFSWRTLGSVEGSATYVPNQNILQELQQLKEQARLLL